MSTQQTTPVDVDGRRLGPMVSIDPPSAEHRGRPMHTIAAYYVMVATEQAHAARQPRYRVVSTRPSRTERFVAAVTSLVRPARRGATQPA
jgi:hypothetical protein